MKYVETVYFLRFYIGYSPSEGGSFYFNSEGVALVFSKLFRVVEEWIGIAVGKDDGSGDNGSGKGTASGLIASSLSATGFFIRG